MVAVETIHGFQKVHVSHQKNVGNTTLFGSDKNYKKDKTNTNCVFCQHDHRICQCNTSKEEDINHQWETIFNAWEAIISHKHVKTVEYVGLMVVQTCTIICYIKKTQKKQGNQTLMSLRRSTRGSQLKAHIHQQ